MRADVAMQALTSGNLEATYGMLRSRVAEDLHSLAGPMIAKCDDKEGSMRLSVESRVRFPSASWQGCDMKSVRVCCRVVVLVALTYDATSDMVHNEQIPATKA